MKSFGAREMTYRLMFIANSIVSNDVSTVSVLSFVHMKSDGPQQGECVLSAFILIEGGRHSKRMLLFV